MSADTDLMSRFGRLEISCASRENQNAVCRQCDLCGCRQTVPRRSVGGDAARIPLHVRIEPFVIDVAVENLVPVAADGKADAITK